jgi:MA3 domain
MRRNAVSYYRELFNAGVEPAAVVESMLTNSLEMKGTNWENLYSLLERCAASNSIPQAALEQGIRKLLEKLDDLTVDVPKAPVQIGDLAGRLVAARLVDLKTIGTSIAQADQDDVPEGEDTMLVESGGAKRVLGCLLKRLLEAAEADAKALWEASELDLKSFVPATDRDEDIPQQFRDEFALEALL